MDKNNLQPGEETSAPSSDDDQAPEPGAGGDQAPDSAIQRMTTDEPVDPKGG